MKVKVSPVIT